MLQEMAELIRNRPLYVIVLTPNQEEIAKREASRPKKGYGLWSIGELDRQLRDETPKMGMWLDSSSLSPEETAEEIWQRVWTEARI